MAHYILQTIAFQAFFLLVYDLFLKKETFFRYNRAYLIVTPLLALVIPLVKINGFKNIISQDYIVNLPVVIVGGSAQNNTNAFHFNAVLIEANALGVWELVWYLGMACAVVFFFYKMAKLFALLYKSPKIKQGRLFIVEVLNSITAFSFFNYVFLGNLIKTHEKSTILKHEMVHVKQKHSLDLLFFEILRIPFWFNPLVYVFQSRMVELHEFMADAHAIKNQNKLQYYQNLLSQVFGVEKISFINPFYKQSLIKKRIVMLQKSKSKQLNLLKYTLLIPLVLGMLVYSSCAQSSDTKDNALLIENEEQSPIISKINAVKSQIEKQGHVSETEDYGLNLLVQLIKPNSGNENIIEDIKGFVTQSPKTELTEKITAVFEQIQVQGNLNEDEVMALKSVLIFIDKDGFKDLFYEDALQEVSMPFGVIDEVPVFLGCESLKTNQERKTCMQEKVSLFIQENFNANLGKQLGLTGRQRIVVMFKINSEGAIVADEVNAKAAHKDLENEAVRVVKELPRMSPGKQGGKNVNVMYSLPIIFEIPE